MRVPKTKSDSSFYQINPETENLLELYCFRFKFTQLV